MLNFSNLADRDLELTRAVVTELNDKVPAIGSHRLMIVGARCRDLIHSALGMTGPSAATSDLDLAIALTGWHEFEEIRGSYVPLGSNGIRFRIAGVPVDVVPFGPLENPTGVIAPPPRIEPGDVEMLTHSFVISHGQRHTAADKRRAIIDAFTGGLTR